MHEIQIHILKKLIFSKKAKYCELKPQTTEGNLFSYHLQSLTKKGYIKLTSSYYQLTAKGKQYADRISAETIHPRIQPKIVTLLVLKQKNKYLLYKRKRMPFIDHVGFPYGKIHLEERVQEAAQRELLEKTGLKAVLKHKGDVYITVHDETELISHMLCHVFVGSKITGELSKHNPAGECFWSRVEDQPKAKLIPGVLQIEKALVKNKSKFFFEEYFLNTSEEE